MRESTPLIRAWRRHAPVDNDEEEEEDQPLSATELS